MVPVPVLLSLAVKTPVEEPILPRFSSFIDQETGVVAPLAEKVVALPLIRVGLEGVITIVVVVADDEVSVWLNVSSTAASHKGHPISIIPLKPSPNKINGRFFLF